jgi:zinc transport system substrate-binding protein
MQALAPPDATVRTLMPPGRSEHGYEFTPSDIAAVGQADVVVYVGLGLEPAVDKFVRRKPSDRRRVVVLGDVLGIDHEHDHHHEHGEACDHAVDVHVWLDPILMRAVVPELRRAIEEAQRSAGRLTDRERTRLDQAQAELIRRLDDLDREFREALEPLRGAAIVTHHSAFGRLAERYGLRVAAVIRPVEGSEPTPAQIAQVVEAMRREGVGVIFVEPQFSEAAARRIAERTGARIGRLDPLGTGDYFALMRANLASLVQHLTPPQAP